MFWESFIATRQKSLFLKSYIYKLVAAFKSLWTCSIPPYLSIFYIKIASLSSIMYFKLIFERIGKWIWPISLSFLFDKNSSIYLKVTLSISYKSTVSSPLNYSTFLRNFGENFDNKLSLIWNEPPSLVLRVLILLDATVGTLLYFYAWTSGFFFAPILIFIFINQVFIIN